MSENITNERKISLPLTEAQIEWLRRRAITNGRSVRREAQQIVEAERQKDGGAV